MTLCKREALERIHFPLFSIQGIPTSESIVRQLQMIFHTLQLYSAESLDHLNQKLFQLHKFIDLTPVA